MSSLRSASQEVGEIVQDIVKEASSSTKPSDKQEPVTTSGESSKEEPTTKKKSVASEPITKDPVASKEPVDGEPITKQPVDGEAITSNEEQPPPASDATTKKGCCAVFLHRMKHPFEKHCHDDAPAGSGESAANQAETTPAGQEGNRKEGNEQSN